jgi:hypothetical protein
MSSASEKIKDKVDEVIHFINDQANKHVVNDMMSIIDRKMNISDVDDKYAEMAKAAIDMASEKYGKTFTVDKERSIISECRTLHQIYSSGVKNINGVGNIKIVMASQIVGLAYIKKYGLSGDTKAQASILLIDFKKVSGAIIEEQLSSIPTPSGHSS